MKKERERTNEVGHVGDVNSNFEGSILVSSDRKSIVEILSGLWIDGENPALPEILPDLELAVGDGLKERGNRRRSQRRERAISIHLQKRERKTYPRSGRKALDDTLGEVLGGEAEERVRKEGQDLEISRTKGMTRLTCSP